MSSSPDSPTVSGVRLGLTVALGFSFTAALPLGLLGLVMCVETVRGTALEMPWSGYGAILLVVFGSYFVAGAIAGSVFTLLRPLRQLAYGWAVTGFMIAVIGYGTMGVAIAAFYDQAGKYIMDHSSQAEAWEMVPWVTLLMGIVGAGVGLARWFQSPESPRHVRARAAAATSTPVHPFIIVQRGYKRPSARVLLAAAAIALAAWVRFVPQSPDQAQTDGNDTNGGVIVTAGVSDSTDAVARRFIRLAQRHALDSAGHLVSATLHLGDSTLLPGEIASRIPGDTTLALTRTVAERWTDGSDVTRTIEAYALHTPTDSETVVLQTVEEMGVRWIERADVEHGVVRTLHDAARASDSAAARLARDTVPIVRVRR